jgi:hypothetical protein
MGFYDGTTQAIRFGFFAFCGAAFAAALSFLADYVGWRFLSYVAIAIMLPSLGVGFWAVLFADHSKVNRPPR